MTGEITERRAGVQVSGYAQANGGIIKNPADEKYANIGAALGGEINYKGTYLKAEAGAGTALTGKLELGHEFDLSKNMGLDISAKATANKTLKSSKLMSNFNYNVNGILGEMSSVTTWHPGDVRVGLQPELTFKSKNDKFKFGVGVEGGWRKSTSPDIEHNYLLEYKPETGSPVNLNDTVKYDLNKSGAYITPTVSAEVKLGKIGDFSLVANADMYQGQAGIRYTF